MSEHDKTISETTNPVTYTKYDPDKRFSFTWPGHPARVVGGAELTAICRGAAASMLDIKEEVGAPSFDHRDE